MSRPSAYDDAYPRELWTNERAHLHARVPGRELPADRPSDAVVGVALSGRGDIARDVFGTAAPAAPGLPSPAVRIFGG